MKKKRNSIITMEAIIEKQFAETRELIREQNALLKMLVSQLGEEFEEWSEIEGEPNQTPMVNFPKLMKCPLTDQMISVKEWERRKKNIEKLT